MRVILRKNRSSPMSKASASDDGKSKQEGFHWMVSINQLIFNCPVTHADITNAYNIFGPDLASIQGNIVQHMP
jgi:hypothetical protein